MKDIKIGIYGGTFDPVHVGHIKSAYAFLNACALDKLFIIPNYLPPHKAIYPGDDPEIRLEMLKLAFSPLPFYNDKIVISSYEIRNREVSYTYKTLEHFSFISKDLTLLCGTDSFLSLEEWKNPEEIFRLAAIAHVVRPGKNADSERISEAKSRYTDKYGARIIDVPMAPVDVSSTEIREMIRNKKDTSLLLPRQVREYIDVCGLYDGKNE